MKVKILHFKFICICTFFVLVLCGVCCGLINKDTSEIKTKLSAAWEFVTCNKFHNESWEYF